MSKNLVVKNNNQLHAVLENYAKDNDLTDTVYCVNNIKNVGIITGRKGGLQFTTTIKKEKLGVIKTDTTFIKSNREALIEQVRDLRNQGYKQVEISRMLNISQSSVSKYTKK